MVQKLNEKYMSDEETDIEDNSLLLKHSLTWRSERLNTLIQKLDFRYMEARKKKENSKPLKARKDGSPSKRGKPPNPPKWAVKELDISDEDANPTVATTAPEEAPASPEVLSDLEAPETDEIDSWLYEVAGIHSDVVRM